MIKSAQDILKDYPWDATDHREKYYHEDDVIKAMNQFGVQFMKPSKCYNCDGTGQVLNTECITCKGNGSIIVLPMTSSTTSTGM